MDLACISKPSKNNDYGLSSELFGVHPRDKPVDGNTLVLATGKVLSVKLSATLFAEHQFEVDCTLDVDTTDAAIQFQVVMEPPTDAVTWDASAPIVAIKGGYGESQLLAEFRRIFPPNVCYPHIIPLDEVVCLKTFHREDQPLIELFLSEHQTAELDRLWAEHRFITKFPVVENEYLPLFIGFVTHHHSCCIWSNGLRDRTPVNDWELTSRLSYFLWSSMPDDDLRERAATGHLHQPGVLAAQAMRMLKDERSEHSRLNLELSGFTFSRSWVRSIQRWNRIQWHRRSSQLSDYNMSQTDFVMSQNTGRSVASAGILSALPFLLPSGMPCSASFNLFLLRRSS